MPKGPSSSQTRRTMTGAARLKGGEENVFFLPNCILLCGALTVRGCTFARQGATASRALALAVCVDLGPREAEHVPLARALPQAGWISRVSCTVLHGQCENALFRTERPPTSKLKVSKKLALKKMRSRGPE